MYISRATWLSSSLHLQFYVEVMVEDFTEPMSPCTNSPTQERPHPFISMIYYPICSLAIRGLRLKPRGTAQVRHRLVKTLQMPARRDSTTWLELLGSPTRSFTFVTSDICAHAKDKCELHPACPKHIPRTSRMIIGSITLVVLSLEGVLPKLARDTNTCRYGPSA